MALDPFVEAWAKQFMYSGIGVKVPAKLELDEASTLSMYKKYFEWPVKYFMNYDRDVDLQADDARKFLRELKSNQLYSALYILPILTIPAEDEVWPILLKHAIEKFTSEHVAYFGVFTKANTCIVCYVNEADRETVGAYPSSGTMYPLIPISTKGASPDAIGYLCKKNPTAMSDEEVFASQYLLDSGVVVKEDFQQVTFNLPGKGLCLVRGFDLVDVPYCVRKIIQELPPAFIMENGGDVYEAAYKFAKSNKSRYPEEYEWLNDLVVSPSTDSADSTGSIMDTLNDEVVKNYLVANYGMNPERSLGQLFSSPASYMNCDDMVQAVNEYGVEKVLSNMQDDPAYLTGTLDELIANYCREEHIDTKCTIAQLIHYINYDVTIQPPDLVAFVGDYVMSHTGFDTDTTVKEILLGEVHKKPNVAEICMNYVSELKNLSDDYKRGLIDAITTEKVVEMPTFKDFIETMGISKESQSAIDLILNGDVADARKALITKLASSDERVVNSVMLQLNTPKTNNQVLSDREKAVRDAAAHILNGFRDYLMEADTDDKRLAGQSILYSYLKILYQGRSTLEDDKEFLLNKVSTCTNEGVKRILMEAIEIYTR